MNTKLRYKKNQFEEAKTFVRKWIDVHGCEPDESKLHEYFYLFADINNLNPIFDEKMKLCGNYDQSKEYIKKHKPLFGDYKEFLKACR